MKVLDQKFILGKGGGITPLERSETATRGGLAGDARAVTTLLCIDGSPGYLRKYTVWGDLRGYTGTGTVRRTGGPDCGRDQALMKSQKKRRE